MSRTVDRTVEDLDQAMRELRKSLRGIPFDNLARDAALVAVLIDSARSSFRN